MISIGFVMFLLWAYATLLGIWGVRLAQVMALKTPKVVARPLNDYAPRAAVILPIKGVDDDTEENIQALLEQDYPHYRLLFTVESADDPVVSLLERIAAEDGRGRIEIVVSGLATSRGQKVHNQLAAVDRTHGTDEVLVFMDADARPKPGWLRALVNPLQWEHIGAATGFRFYVPVGPHITNVIVSVLNAGVAALLGPFRRTFCWGGSMAVRRADFLKHVRPDWEGALSDDYVMSWCVKNRMKLKIKFVPQCIVASQANFNWGEFFEFACRQYRITKVCAFHVWLTAVGGALLYLGIFGYTLGGWIYGLYIGNPDHWLILMWMFFYGCTLTRGVFLFVAAMRLLPEYNNQWKNLRLQFWWTWAYPLVVFVNLLALLGSAFGRSLVWRKVGYTMVSRTQTLVHRPESSKRLHSEGGARELKDVVS